MSQKYQRLWRLMTSLFYSAPKLFTKFLSLSSVAPNMALKPTRILRAAYLVSCRIPDDCIDPKRYPLFVARAVLQELIEFLQSTPGATPC